jgi:hypothetical protein
MAVALSPFVGSEVRARCVRGCRWALWRAVRGRRRVWRMDGGCVRARLGAWWVRRGPGLSWWATAPLSGVAASSHGGKPLLSWPSACLLSDVRWSSSRRQPVASLVSGSCLEGVRWSSLRRQPGLSQTQTCSLSGVGRVCLRCRSGVGQVLTECLSVSGLFLARSYLPVVSPSSSLSLIFGSLCYACG